MNDEIILFPDFCDVFEDLSLACYFRPLMTKMHQVGDRGYPIHLVSTDGMFCEVPFLYAENNFFGFEYKNGKYQFMGDLRVFGESNFNDVYQVLVADFEKNKDDYLERKVSASDYSKKIKPLVDHVAQFSKGQDLGYFSEALYSYLFTKYYYEKTGKFKNIREVTSNYANNTDPILLSQCDIETFLQEFFLNMKYNLKNSYNLSAQMAVCGTSGYRFTLWGGETIAFLDEDASRVFILEYHS